MTTDLCWCGSGKAYADCHSEIDAKIELYRKAGHEVPDREMIKTPEQIAGIREACKINTAVWDEVEKNIKTGMTTEEINTIVHEYTVSHGAIPAPLNFCGFPKSVCTSINDQVCHGIPSAQDVLKSGDIVNVDVSTIYNGYYADASRMFMIGKVDKKKQDLVAITKECLRRGLEAAQPWSFVGDIGAAVSGFAHKHFLRDAGIKDSIHELLNKRDGLMLGICNGFQALIKLGLVPYGEIRDEMTGDDPTLTFNLIGRHQSRYATTRVASVKSPWLSSCNVGDLHSIAFSHGEGRFVAPQNVIDDLIKNGQVAFQYTDLNGDPSMDIAWNPNGSMCAIEGITSPDGRVLGKMGHTERYSPFVGKNIYGEKYQPLFANGVKYFK